MEQDAERVDVRRWRGDEAAEPFGSVVGGRREGDDTSADLVEAEVCDVGVAVVVEQHVLRAQAPVYQAMAVGGGHPGGDRLEDRQCVGRGEPAAWDARREVAPADQTADHHRPIRFAPVVEQRDQRRVLGPGDPLRCPLEAADEQRVDDDAGVEEAHRHLATDRRLVGAVDLAELACTDQGAQLEAGNRSLGPRQQRWKPIELQRWELAAEATAHELVDVDVAVEPDDVEAAE